MNLAQSIAFNRAVRAGGPGSGRHPEYGAMHQMLTKHGYALHPSGKVRQDYIHPKFGVHLEVNPQTGGWRRAEYPEHEGGHGAKTLHDYLHGKYGKIAAGGPGSGRHKELWSLHDELKDHPARANDYPSVVHEADYTSKLERLYRGVAFAVNQAETIAPVSAFVRQKLDWVRGQLDVVKDSYSAAHADHALAAMHGILNVLSNPKAKKIAANKKIAALFDPTEPRDDHGRWSRELGGGVTTKTITDRKGRTVDVYSKNGIVQAAIPRSEYPLTPEQEIVERRFSEQIGSDPERWKREYSAANGNTLNADLAKELSPDYMKDKTLAMAVHEPASWLIKQIWKDELSQTKPDKANVALFTAGGAGSGKTSSIQDPETKALLDSAQIVYDGTLRPADKAIARVGQALAAGKNASVLHVDRDHVAAFRDGMLGRAARDEARSGSGRIVTLPEFVAQHSSIRDSMKKLYETYKDNPRFSFGVVDNNYGPGNAKRTTLDNLPPTKPPHEMYQELKGVLDEEYQKGNISQKIYKAVLDHGEAALHKEIGV